VPVGILIIFVNFDDIDWIKAADQYVIVHVGPKEHLLRESLEHIASTLPHEGFARVHRSHVVNVSTIREVSRLPKGEEQVTLAEPCLDPPYGIR
jgi:two-component system, LytTR family, response regulator